MLLCTALASLIVLVAAAGGAPAGQVPVDKVDRWVAQRVAQAGRSEVLVILAARADLGAATAGLTDRLDRRRAVVAALRATAASSQADLRRGLTTRRIPHRSFFVVNALLLEADPALLVDLAAEPDVARVVGNPRVGFASPESRIGPGLTGAVPWGVDRIRAPEVWTLGFTGAGIVVGGQDTGVRWTHEAVRDHYRGWDGATASHDYNWHDSIHLPAGANPCGGDALAPCDDYGHGTHTVATAAGGSPNEAVGVAPGAQWITCRNMDAGVGTPATYLECFEFFLAPWPIGGSAADGDPTQAPDVTVNSWTCPPSEGCAWDVLQGAVEAQRAAGIFTVVSAGNSGASCGSVGAPPAIYRAAFSIGASDGGDGLAGFSSRGPAADTGEAKPDVVAPGVWVRSATNAADDSYDQWSGTSMAGPHVAGAVALLWSAVPALRGDVAATEELLERTARPLRTVVEGCGGDYAFGPNHSWGHGRIDVAQALAAYGLPASEADCANTVDDDGDGFTDCADDDCAGAANCPEAGNCRDYLDNDQDGRTDCADDQCAGDPLCPERGNCTDGVDNDLDTAVDCDDRDCDTDPACPGLALGPLMLLSPRPVPRVAEVYNPACRDPSWLICPQSIQPGPAPGRLTGKRPRKRQRRCASTSIRRAGTSWSSSPVSISSTRCVDMCDRFTLRSLTVAFTRRMCLITVGLTAVASALAPRTLAACGTLPLHVSPGVVMPPLFALDGSFSFPHQRLAAPEELYRVGDAGGADSATQRLYAVRGPGPDDVTLYADPACSIAPLNFADGAVYLRDMHVATTGRAGGDGSPGDPFDTIAIAAAVAVPGDDIIVHQGSYPDASYITGLTGTAANPIRIRGAGGEPPPVLGSTAVSEALHLTDPAYVVLEDLVVAGPTGNGINIDDGDVYATPAHHVVVRRVTIRDIGTGGNEDCLKLSGLDDFWVTDCDIQRCGTQWGSGIDMVGCHSGWIGGNTFRNTGANAVQAKGGSADVEIHGNLMVSAGDWAMNLGGSTGLQYFRPPTIDYEAANLRAIANVVVDSQAPVAYVGCDGCLVANNTFYLPTRWVARILQETVDPRFIQCRNGRFINNVVVFDSASIAAFVNVGGNTQPSTFTFANNLWFSRDNPGFSGPSLPVVETDPIIQQDPVLLDPAGEDFRIPPASPAVAGGVCLPELGGDRAGACYDDPPAVGAYEGP